MQCPVSNSHSESISHLLRECPHSVSFWDWLPLDLSPLSACLSQIGYMPTAPPSKPLGTTISHGVCSFSSVFGPSGLTGIRLPSNLQSNPHLLKDCIATVLEYHFLTSPSTPSMPRARTNCNWINPPYGLVQIKYGCICY